MNFAHEILLALAYVSQISDPDALKSRFFESMNAMDGRFVFAFSENPPPHIPQHRTLPIATIRSSFGYAVMTECPEEAEAEQGLFRNAFQFLAVILENRIHTRAMESKNISLLEDIQQEKSTIRTVLETLPVGVCVTDSKGNIVIENDTGTRIWDGVRHRGGDRPGEHMVWRSDSEAPPEPREQVLAKLIETGRPIIDQELDIEALDGSHKTILNSAVPLRDHKGTIIGGVFVDQDITERKRAERELRTTLAKYRTLFDAFPLGITVADEKGRIVESNPESVRVLGLPARDQAERNIDGTEWTVVRLDGSPMPPEEFASVRALRDRQTVGNVEMGILTPSGETSWISVTAAPLPEGGVVATYKDIGSRKLAEQALREREEIFSSIVGQAADAIALVDSTTLRYIEFNTAAHEGLGYTREEFAALTIPDIQAEHSFDVIKKNSELARTTGGIAFETQHRHRNGEARDVRVSVRPLRIRNRDYLTIVWTDITEQKRAAREKALLESRLAQSQKMEAIGTLAGGVAHDFNNVLTVIMGFGEMMRMELAPDDRHRPLVDEILNASRRAAELTRSLLAFSRKQRISLEPHEINEVLADVSKILKRLLTEDITLTVELNESAMVMLDVAQIHQVLMNLSTNARDAMPHGGTLAIKTSVVTVDKTPDSYDAVTPGTFVRLSVSDTGVGMDEQTVAHIFEPFFTTKEVGKGTGLGLASVYGIVKQHNGYITASSEPLKGTTFDIYLPVSESARTPPVEAPHELVGGSETILVVEDEPSVRALIVSILSGQGYSVLEAQDGREAVRVFSEHQDAVRLVILDVVMPGKNGRAALDEIACINPKVKAIFMSGYTGDVVIDKGVPKEDVAFLQKPLSVPKLLEKVRWVLDN